MRRRFGRGARAARLCAGSSRDRQLERGWHGSQIRAFQAWLCRANDGLRVSAGLVDECKQLG